MDDSLRALDLAAAQPTFSDEELDVLSRKLGMTDGLCSAADRDRLLEVLRDVAEDAVDFEDLVGGIRAAQIPAAERSPLAAHRPFTSNRRRRVANLDASLLADQPTTGRDLSNAAAKALINSE